MMNNPLATEWTTAILLIVICVIIPWWLIICGIRAKKRRKEELKKKVHDAIDNILEDGKVDGPKGKYKSRRGRWAKKWINYANSLPMPRGRYQMSGGDLPTLERDDRD